jgi:hypothetical protein
MSEQTRQEVLAQKRTLSAPFVRGRPKDYHPAKLLPPLGDPARNYQP